MRISQAGHALSERRESKGFSMVELILAMAIFVIFSGGVVAVMLSSFDSNRLGAEQTIANQFAAEGVEAVRSIKNQAYANLANSSGVGVAKTAGVWAFSGTNNTFDKYTRVITVGDVYRDGNGNIVPSGGTLDPSTKKISATVSWLFSPTRNNSVVLSTYLTDWKAPIGLKGGMLVYGDGSTTSDAIKYRILDGATGNWGAVNSLDVDAGTTNKALRVARVYASPTRNEKILLSRHYNGTTQYIYAAVFNGTSWGTSQLLSSWNATTFLDVKNFGGSYLSNGDFMVVYSDNTTTPKFQVWNGTSWSGQISTQNVGGIPNNIIVSSRPGTNEVMVATFDQASDTNSEYFNGSSYVTGSWALSAEHSTTAPLATKEFVDFTWSPNNPTKGALIFASGSTDRAMNIKIWTANGSGGGGWSGTVNTSNQGTLGAMEIAGRFGADEFVACDKDANNDIYCFRSNTTPVWTTPTNNILTATTDTGIQRSFDLDFEAASGTEAITVYSDNTATPKLRKYTVSSNAFDATPTNISALSGILKTVKLRTLSGTDDLMILLADANRRLYSVVWNGTSNAVYADGSGKSFTSQGINGSAVTEYWYDFAWDSN